ncbi:Uncharacterised protein [Staphylococcus aureus]|nr:Uncharacterised protein [Staphylococcus aureus]
MGKASYDIKPGTFKYIDVNVNIKMYINDCIRMYKIVC